MKISVGLVKLRELRAGRVQQEKVKAPTWPCPHCGQESTIDDVFPSQDGERMLTLWRCERCQIVAVTPASSHGNAPA